MNNDIKKKVSLRETWIDNVKAIACILVVLGHLFQSLVKANILVDSILYRWFDKTIYYFHVPLFFICSGYLYQKYSIVNSFKTWKHHVIKKFFVLGIPYVTFSILTWILKIIFAGYINSPNNESIFRVLLLHPQAPYWYLYALFFIFLITPTFFYPGIKYTIIVFSIVFKIISFLEMPFRKSAFVDYILCYEILFVSGMVIAESKLFESIRKKKRCYISGILSGVIFLLLSINVFNKECSIRGGINFMMTILACSAVIMTVGYIFRDNNQNSIMKFLSIYTMPIYLMHTLCSAPTRCLLIKFNIINPVIQVVVGLTAGIGGPIIISEMLKKTKSLEIFIHPQNFFDK